MSKLEISIQPLAYREPQAAAALGVSERTLHDWRKAGDVPHVKKGGCVLYPVRELADWLSRQITLTDAQPSCT